MKRSILVLITFFLSGFGFSQTPLIMHKRMGGHEDNFHQAMQQTNNPIRQSNFGLPPTIYVKRAVIDSIIALNDSAVVVVTSQRVVEQFHWHDYASFDTLEQVFVCSDSMLQRSLTYDSTRNWTPGRDTLINHAVFNANLSCRDILFKLRDEFNLHQNGNREIEFIGFDCSIPKGKKGNSVPFMFLNFPKGPDFWIGVTFLFSLLYFLILYANRKYASATQTTF